MANELDPGTALSVWFHWLPRSFLLVAIVLPLLSALGGLQAITLDAVTLSILVIIIFIIVSRAPVLGGIITITAVPLWLIAIGLMYYSVFEPIRWFYNSFDCFLLLSGGILSIIWGRHQQQSLGNHPRFAIASLIIGSLMVPTTLIFIFLSILDSIVQASGWPPGLLYVLLVFGVNSIGLISGIVGLKSNLKGIAIAGMVLCTFAFVPFVVFGRATHYI
jgi:hypothetical protein